MLKSLLNSLYTGVVFAIAIIFMIAQTVTVFIPYVFYNSRVPMLTDVFWPLVYAAMAVFSIYHMRVHKEPRKFGGSWVSIVVLALIALLNGPLILTILAMLICYICVSWDRTEIYQPSDQSNKQLVGAFASGLSMKANTTEWEHFRDGSKVGESTEFHGGGCLGTIIGGFILGALFAVIIPFVVCIYFIGHVNDYLVLWRYPEQLRKTETEGKAEDNAETHTTESPSHECGSDNFNP